MSKIPFTKMHGCGNDYIYVNTMQYDIPDPAAASIKWSNRYKGIGSDGLVLIGKSTVPEADYTMRIFNADGSEARMCGNASRCIGKYLYERGLTDKTEIRLLTLSGVKILNLHITDNKVESVTVDMLEPVLENEEQFIAARAQGHGTFVSMGNPHYVIFTDNVDQVGETGRVLEHHPAFPQRCNIEFAAPLSCVPSVASDQRSSASPEGDTRAGKPCCKSNEAPSGAVGGAFVVFGVNALALYVCSELLAILFGHFGISDAIYSVLHAVIPWDKWASLAYALTFVAVNYAIGYVLWKRKIFIKL